MIVRITGHVPPEEEKYVLKAISDGTLRYVFDYTNPISVEVE